MLHPRGSGTAARGLLQETGKGLKALPGAPGVWQGQGTGWGGSELRHSPQGRDSHAPSSSTGRLGDHRKPQGSRCHPSPPLSQRNLPPQCCVRCQEPPTPPRPGPARPPAHGTLSSLRALLVPQGAEPGLPLLLGGHIALLSHPGASRALPQRDKERKPGKSLPWPQLARPAPRFAPRHRGSGTVTSRATSRQPGWSRRQRRDRL